MKTKLENRKFIAQKFDSSESLLGVLKVVDDFINSSVDFEVSGTSLDIYYLDDSLWVGREVLGAGNSAPANLKVFFMSQTLATTNEPDISDLTASSIALLNRPDLGSHFRLRISGDLQGNATVHYFSEY